VGSCPGVKEGQSVSWPHTSIVC